MPTHTTCRACNKTCLRTSGFRRHLQRCKATNERRLAKLRDGLTTQAERRKSSVSSGEHDTDYSSSSQPVLPGSRIYPSTTDVDTAADPAMDGYARAVEESARLTEEPVPDDPIHPDALGVFDDLPKFAIVEDGGQTDAANDTRAPGETDAEGSVSVATSVSMSIGRGRLSSAQSSSAPTVEQYTTATGKPAGSGMYRYVTRDLLLRMRVPMSIQKPKVALCIYPCQQLFRGC